MAVITSGSHITLHYRLAVLGDDGEREIVSTLGGPPATLQLGAGCLAPALEQRLIGLEEGAQASFDLTSGQAFGPRDPNLVQALARTEFERHAQAGAACETGDVLEFHTPGGDRVAGVVKDRDHRRVVIDFNHPLAGLPVRFSVRVIGVL
ncbi:MAG: FKBP-type peptidyl-prolyl cis-trans isomerase [Gemmatimonadota bacterium]